MSKTLTYRQLFEFLVSLGFEERPGEFPTFVRTDIPDTWFAFGKHGIDHTVYEHDILNVGFMLDARGILDRDEFDAFVGSKAKLPA